MEGGDAREPVPFVKMESFVLLAFFFPNMRVFFEEQCGG